ncbi:MAG: enoyl-CoA hydratase/isomerase family protein [Deltaproteobacteria bacterium]|nr:enoyl-CoA hydratase/isomerase family protein [Deltaproteobacteria bacterium]
MQELTTVRFEVSDRIATITLNRPDKLNAMNQAMKDDLREVWTEVRENPDVWVAILTGAGRAFSSGAEVEALDGKGFRRTDHWSKLAMIDIIRALPTPRRMSVKKPVIAAVNGVVNGVSLDLVTESDIPIASERAQFFDSHVSIGYVSSHEMVNMARRVPLAVAMRMALLGSKERMSAERALAVGLVTEIVPHDQLLDRARELAGLICENAPLAVWGTKMGILRGLELPVEQAEEIAANYLEIVEQTEDHDEGPRAFLEKRKPEWKGR